VNTEQLLLEKWRALPPTRQKEVLEFIESLERGDIPAADISTYQPRTALGGELWRLRQKAISEGETLLTSTEVEQELMERRGGYIEP